MNLTLKLSGIEFTICGPKPENSQFTKTQILVDKLPGSKFVKLNNEFTSNNLFHLIIFSYITNFLRGGGGRRGITTKNITQSKTVTFLII